MAELWQFQSNMNRGELDPLLVGRLDLAAYYNGVELARNMLSIPQGGMKKRNGTRYLDTAEGDGRVENFSFNVEQNYLLVFTAAKMHIYKNGVLQTNINGSGLDYLATPWTLAQIQEFDYIQSADTIIITHEDVQTRAISRTSDTSWTITAITFSNIPEYDFNDASSPTPTNEVQTLVFANYNPGDVFNITLDQIQTEDISWANDSTTNQEAIEAAIQRLPNTGISGVSVSASSITTYVVTFSGASAFPYNLMSATPVNTQNNAFTAAVTRSSTGVSRTEPTWSAGRGWPRTCTFHEGRLWFGGSSSRPSTLWGSKVGDFFNFDSGRAFDDDSIEATLDTDQVNAIEAVYSNRTLQIFTSGQEFYIPASPITPESIAVKPQSNMGSKRVRPVTIDGVTLFVQRTGKALVQFVFLDEFQANQAQSISFLASHLIKDPVKQSVRRGTTGEDANYIFINNSDGTITVYNTLAAEEVSGFTRWEAAADGTGTAGDIRSSCVVDGELNILVKRTINSATVYLLEVEDENFNTDCGVRATGLASDTLTGLSHLEGETVEVKADGAYMLDKTVSGGQITTERTADTIEAGLGWRPTLTMMPLNVQLQNGPNASSKKKIARASVQLYESNGVTINGQQLADRTIGADQFEAPIPQTGVKRIHLLGWSLEAQVTITQNSPMPMTILNVGMEVKT